MMCDCAGWEIPNPIDGWRFLILSSFSSKPLFFTGFEMTIPRLLFKWPKEVTSFQKDVKIPTRNKWVSYADVAKLANASDLESESCRGKCGFESRRLHHQSLGYARLPSRSSKLRLVGSTPTYSTSLLFTIRFGKININNQRTKNRGLGA